MAAPGSGLAASADWADGDGRAASAPKTARLAQRPTHGCVQPRQRRSRNTARANGAPSSVPNTTISTEPSVENSAASAREPRQHPHGDTGAAAEQEPGHQRLEDPRKPCAHGPHTISSRDALTHRSAASDMAIWPVMAATRPDVSQRLAEIGRRFDQRGWMLGTSGNLSGVVEREPLRLAITPSGTSKGELSADQILEIDATGAVIHGDRRAVGRGAASRRSGPRTRARVPCSTRIPSGARCSPIVTRRRAAWPSKATRC